MNRKTVQAPALVLPVAMGLVLLCGTGARSQEADAPAQQEERVYKQSLEDEGALTKEMLEACINLKAEIDADYAAISETREAYEALDKEVKELAAYLRDNKDKTDSEGAEFLMEYREKGETHHKKLQELKQLSESYTPMKEPYEEKVARFNQECQGQQYYEDDYAEMVEKLGRGM